jgi:hypothetical protein
MKNIAMLKLYGSTYEIITKKGDIYLRMKIYTQDITTGEYVEINDIGLKGAKKVILEVMQERDMLDLRADEN